MNDKNIQLANLIFPDINITIEDLEVKYPVRSEEGSITRFAPSPTGFLHTGALFTTLVNKIIAKKSSGKYFLRIEDTDSSREVEGSVKLFTDELAKFDLSPDEGVIAEDKEIGDYGPYTQSKRKNIYHACAKYLIEQGLAYPCFCSKENITATRELQEKNKVVPGYYGVYAKCRNLTIDEYIEKVEAGNEFILRFRSSGNHLKKMSFVDAVKGKIEMAENDQDLVIMKKDKLPTYHFAHVCDDHFMRTTHVARGEEWLPSTPMHIELFKAMNFTCPTYIHIPLIMVKDGDSRRKLSKRKDKEAAVSYFITSGYPVEGVIEYLMTLMNSNFEMWRQANKDKSIYDFDFKLNKMSSAGSLLDMDKLKDLCKNYIASLSSEKLYEKIVMWSKDNNEKIHTLITRDESYSKRILAIERDNAKKVRKDLIKYEDFISQYSYFFEEEYEQDILENGYDFAIDNENINNDLIKEILKEYINVFDINDTKEQWFNKIKELCAKFDFTTDMKAYKQDPSSFKGNVAQLATIIRIAITNKSNTPDLSEIMNAISETVVLNRINNVIKNLK